MLYFGIQIGGVEDWYMTPLYFFLIVFILKRNVKCTSDWEKSLFVRGLRVKLFSALLIAFVYLFYYEGGDTIIYMHDAKVLV
ncbi:MAG: hypothetical protein ACO3E1_11670, partial [Flavobacteriales bacterium]